jgi:hypothetical protein
MQARLSEERHCYYLCRSLFLLDFNFLTAKQFKFPIVQLRSVYLSIPADPIPVPGAVSAIPSEAQSFTGVAATVASSMASEAQSVVASAATTVETAIGSIIPKNCSLRLEYFVIGFTDHIDFKALPLNISNIIPSAITDTLADIGQPSILKTVNVALAEFNPRSIKDCLVISLTFAILAIVPDALYIGFAILNRPEVGPSISWITGPLRKGYSFICCVSLLVPAGILLYILLWVYTGCLVSLAVTGVS